MADEKDDRQAELYRALIWYCPECRTLNATDYQEPIPDDVRCKSCDREWSTRLSYSDDRWN